jgi:hypothetical protein
LHHATAAAAHATQRATHRVTSRIAIPLCASHLATILLLPSPLTPTLASFAIPSLALPHLPLTPTPQSHQPLSPDTSIASHHTSHQPTPPRSSRSRTAGGRRVDQSQRSLIDLIQDTAAS